MGVHPRSGASPAVHPPLSLLCCTGIFTTVSCLVLASAKIVITFLLFGTFFQLILSVLLSNTCYVSNFLLIMHKQRDQHPRFYDTLDTRLSVGSHGVSKREKKTPIPVGVQDPLTEGEGISNHLIKIIRQRMVNMASKTDATRGAWSERLHGNHTRFIVARLIIHEKGGG